jgi:hypothetical protein
MARSCEEVTLMSEFHPVTSNCRLDDYINSLQGYYIFIVHSSNTVFLHIWYKYVVSFFFLGSHLQCIYIFRGFSSAQSSPLKSSIFWDITPCSLLKVNRCFRETCFLHLQGRRIATQETNPEDRGDMFLQNVGWLSADYTGLYLRTRNSSQSPILHLEIIGSDT